MITAPSTSICASAPGKVILFGEHAVVYGVPAIAAALSDLRIYVRVTPDNNEYNKVEIIMKDLPSPVHVVFDSKSLVLPSLNQPPSHDDAETIHKLVSSLEPSLDDLGVWAVTPLVYLMNILVPDCMQDGLKITISSQDLPVGAGLGSSAAFGVACTAALYRLMKMKQDGFDGSAQPYGKPSPTDLTRINQYAFYSEILLHGTPSGIDDAVSTHGGVIVYTKDIKTNEANKEYLDMPPLSLLLTHTHVPRSTKKLVAGVRDMYNQHAAVVQGMLDSIGAIAKEFRDILLSQDFQSHGDDIMTLVRTNQHLLRAVGVSHPSLDYVCSVVDDVAKDNSACKLTGAGGGGCAMTLLRPGCDPEIVQKIRTALQHRRHPWNLTCFTSSVGGDGVLWISPEEFQKHESRKLERVFSGRGLLLGISLTTAALAVVATIRGSLRRS
jgi:mevalonate kinase